MRYEPFCAPSAQEIDAFPQYVQDAVADFIDKVCENPMKHSRKGDISLIRRPVKSRWSRSRNKKRRRGRRDGVLPLGQDEKLIEIETPAGTFSVKNRAKRRSTTNRREPKSARRGMARQALGSGEGAAQGDQPQQTGMLFIIMQQVQPAFIMAVMQSQQAWIMSQQALSPLVQVMQTPSSVISHLHMPIVRLQQQTIMPFIIMQQLHMPPAIIVQRFCIMLQAILSSQVQVIFMPPVHFSIFIVQRGTIMPSWPGHVGIVAPCPCPDIIVVARLHRLQSSWVYSLAPTPPIRRVNLGHGLSRIRANPFGSKLNDPRNSGNFDFSCRESFLETRASSASPIRCVEYGRNLLP